MDIPSAPPKRLQLPDLTGKEFRFCEEYIKDFNATQAALRAGFAKRSAYNIGHDLLKKHEIAVTVDILKNERSKRTQIDADWVLKRLTAEADADVADLYGEDGQLLPVQDWPLIWRQGLITSIDVEELFEGRGEDRTQIGVVRKIKISDRVRRIEMIGKHVDVNAFREQVGHSGPDGGPIQNEAVNAREHVASRIAGIASRKGPGNDTSGTDRSSD